MIFTFSMVKKLKEYFMTCEHYTKFKFQAYSFLEHGHIPSFMHCLGLLSCHKSKVEQVHRDHMASKPIIFTMGPFRKS